MTIDLPDDLERFIREAVRQGRFPSHEAAIAEAVRLLRLQLTRQSIPSAPTGASPTSAADPLLGAMRDTADEIDQVVAAAMRQREHQPRGP